VPEASNEEIQACIIASCAFNYREKGSLVIRHWYASFEGGCTASVEHGIRKCSDLRYDLIDCLFSPTDRLDF
jgi:hypothetical protein